MLRPTTVLGRWSTLALAASGERSLTVTAATILGLLVTAFGVLEVVFPH